MGHERGTFEETADIARSVLVTGAIVSALTTHVIAVPRSVPFAGAAFALVGMFASRFVIRTWRWRAA
ncbi:hypothetical protein H9L10_02125 [Phycicoccus endophyticus]|uniref:Uncharacterized protein n=1 Tax=Phycicoccus endophyticus TaxID=1690220 RepID=A0A7G9R2T2_9MICO|nr:hypothetical protein [Phycicoccus endophyticus]NHI20376.1 hypothetical protein [Phycicoccus endophyticus]QNN49907.1 hypothetical protein H9L10_02125 [Phycicoccus endophyticus]GGL29746.1 hypothetical protein GCM10012283_10120 [Phycicoccus endophyticus]